LAEILCKRCQYLLHASSDCCEKFGYFGVGDNVLEERDQHWLVLPFALLGRSFNACSCADNRPLSTFVAHTVDLCQRFLIRIKNKTSNKRFVLTTGGRIQRLFLKTYRSLQVHRKSYFKPFLRKYFDQKQWLEDFPNIKLLSSEKN